MAIGGSIESVSLSGRSFGVASDAAATLFPGGVNNEVRLNGDQVTARKIETAMPWKTSGLVLSIDFTTDDLQYINSIAKSDFVAMEVTLADDSVWQGTGTITGEFGGDTQASTVALELSGPGEMTRQ